MSDDASFSVHIKKIVEKVNSLVSWILRTFEARDELTMLTLWKTIVLPHIDYCSQLWSPHKKGEIQMIELLQRNFIRKIKGACSLSYWDQLKKLKLYSLERRRERYIIIYVWKILENFVPNFNHEVNGNSAGGISYYNHIRHGRKCVVPSLTKGRVQSIRYGALVASGPRLFNLLPKSIRNTSNSSVNVFKKKLDKYLESVPDEPLIPGYVRYGRGLSNSVRDMISVGLNELNA